MHWLLRFELMQDACAACSCGVLGAARKVRVVRSLSSPPGALRRLLYLAVFSSRSCLAPRLFPIIRQYAQNERKASDLFSASANFPQPLACNLRAWYFQGMTQKATKTSAFPRDRLRSIIEASGYTIRQFGRGLLGASESYMTRRLSSDGDIQGADDALLRALINVDEKEPGRMVIELERVAKEDGRIVRRRVQTVGSGRAVFDRARKDQAAQERVRRVIHD